MNLDGAHLKSVIGERFVLTFPKDEVFEFSFILEFEEINNLVEYGEFILGLEITKDMSITILKIKGDSG